MSMHSVRLKPTKLILIGTRTTYQATGDAGYIRGYHYYETTAVAVSQHNKSNAFHQARNTSFCSSLTSFFTGGRAGAVSLPAGGVFRWILGVNVERCAFHPLENVY